MAVVPNGRAEKGLELRCVCWPDIFLVTENPTGGVAPAAPALIKLCVSGHQYFIDLQLPLDFVTNG